MNRIVTAAAACVLVLVGSTAQAAPRHASDAPEQPSDPNEKVVCKSFTRIGTLAGRYRTCKTKAEWERERINLRQVNVADSCRSRGEGGSGSPVPGSPATYDC
ncbi:MAG TPA: hypothetical protein VFQ67_07780 [Allosphingosinicella sp.]|jgi:hypothetical protein|nr:hypothetical protein [Allosphingosinicella sp.]